jgi:integrase
VIGRASAIKVARAREIASELHAKVRLGGDPAGEKRVQIERASHTFGALAEKYLAQQRTELRPGSYLEVARHLGMHSKPLRALSVDSVDQRTIAERLSAIERNSGAVTSNRVRASLSAMFAWAMREGLAPANPVISTNKRQEKARERVLTDDELRQIWLALGGDHHATIVKLLMLTAQRASEITGLRWEEVDFGRGVISLPGSRTKNGRPHEIPMSPTVRGLLEAQPRRRDLVFGIRGGPFSRLSHGKAALDARLVLSHWTHHDLRRTAATRMADIGIQPHVIEAVLNHVSGHKGGIAGIYNRASYAAEKAAALTRWDTHVAGLVA